jgi:aspartyl-tRNA synthetase
VAGWVHRRRDHGGMVFVDLRDREGMVQVKFNPETDPDAHRVAGRLRSEFCIVVRGDVVERPADMINPKMATGRIEVEARQVDILSECPTPKFEIADKIDVSDELRLKYRYIDLRRPVMQQALRTRHRIIKTVRDHFDAEGFIEIETPILTRSTPEGARDYLVPSRVHPGTFYALPQSPQIFKQLLMIGGFDKYLQIARCFRDEDLRADRQPEFTQLDMEMSFVQADDVFNVIEGAVAAVMKAIHDVDVPRPFPRMKFADAMRDYGTDAPDTRYDLKIQDVTEVARKTDFKVFNDAITRGGVVRCLPIPGGGDMTRKDLDTLAEDLKGIGAGGMPYVKIVDEGGKLALQIGVAKFFTPELTAELCRATGAGAGDVLCFAADREQNVGKYLAWLRGVIARRRGLIPAGKWNYLWIVDVPMFERGEDDQRWYSMHHPFTAPRDEDVELLDSDPGRVRSKGYDLVLNGLELGSGSIRIHRADVQQKIFKLLGISLEEQRHRFGFLLDALSHGPPPHGGIALGLDRVTMLLTGQDNLREVFSFPKTQRAYCPMTEAPSTVSQDQLDDLCIRLAPSK